jgi:hypothetical protein
MEWSLIIGIAVLAVGIRWLVHVIETSPEGYEDEKGFHYGKKLPN